MFKMISSVKLTCLVNIHCRLFQVDENIFKYQYFLMTCTSLAFVLKGNLDTYNNRNMHDYLPLFYGCL